MWVIILYFWNVLKGFSSLRTSVQLLIIIMLSFLFVVSVYVLFMVVIFADGETSKFSFTWVLVMKTCDNSVLIAHLYALNLGSIHSTVVFVQSLFVSASDTEVFSVARNM